MAKIPFLSFNKKRITIIQLQSVGTRASIKEYFQEIFIEGSSDRLAKSSGKYHDAKYFTGSICVYPTTLTETTETAATTIGIKKPTTNPVLRMPLPAAATK